VSQGLSPGFCITPAVKTRNNHYALGAAGGLLDNTVADFAAAAALLVVGLAVNLATVGDRL